jgi:flagellar hook-associated protein 1
MGTISSAFGVITGALNADQAALSIVANNVANANTPGYTEQKPTWRENDPVSINGVRYGAGVTQEGPSSVRDRVLLQRLSQQQQAASSSSARLAALNAIQSLFTPDSGSSSSTAGDIGSDITSLFNSFSSLEANPTNNALRQQVLSSATTLAGDISDAAGALLSQRASLDQEAAAMVSQVNALTASLAGLNAQIQSNSPHADAGILEDQRQQDLSKLSQLIGINLITTENNGLTITTTSGQTLVSENSNDAVTTGLVNGVTHFFVGTADVTAQLASGGGSLGGYLTARDKDIPETLEALDQLAFGIATQVNAANNAGTGFDGIQGTGTDTSGITGNGTVPLYIFYQPVQVAGSAASMRVIATNPDKIAAAAFGQGTGGNGNALKLAQLSGGPLQKQLATADFSLSQNLNSASASVTSTMQVYDALGQNYTATFTFTNLGANTWSYAIALSDPSAIATNATGQLQFDGSGNLVAPASNASGIAFTGLSDGAIPMRLTWQLYDGAGKGMITQTSAPSALTAQTQDGSSHLDSHAPVTFFSNFVTMLGSRVTQVETANAAENASVTQLQNQNNALSAVNLNDEAAALQQLERSYQAASKVFGILNAIMASALNLGVQTSVS